MIVDPSFEAPPGEKEHPALEKPFVCFRRFERILIDRVEGIFLAAMNVAQETAIGRLLLIKIDHARSRSRNQAIVNS